MNVLMHMPGNQTLWNVPAGPDTTDLDRRSGLSQNLAA
jgi:hypothetical protein